MEWCVIWLFFPCTETKFVRCVGDEAEVAAMKKRHEPWRHRLFAYLEYRQLPQELTIDEKTYFLHGEFV